MVEGLEKLTKEELIKIIESLDSQVDRLVAKNQTIYREQADLRRKTTAALEAQNRALMEKIIALADVIPKPFGPLTPEQDEEFWKVMENR